MRKSPTSVLNQIRKRFSRLQKKKILSFQNKKDNALSTAKVTCGNTVFRCSEHSMSGSNKARGEREGEEGLFTLFVVCSSQQSQHH